MCLSRKRPSCTNLCLDHFVSVWITFLLDKFTWRTGSMDALRSHNISYINVMKKRKNSFGDSYVFCKSLGGAMWYIQKWTSFYLLKLGFTTCSNGRMNAGLFLVPALYCSRASRPVSGTRQKPEFADLFSSAALPSAPQPESASLTRPPGWQCMPSFTAPSLVSTPDRDLRSCNCIFTCSA